MNELSLFSGAGGGLLGSKLLGWNPIGYVEWDDYCQRVIAARIKDGLLPNAPIFGDIRTFIDSGCAELYRGITDVVTGGFPCQPFSVAGKQKGAEDKRNMWPATKDVIRIVQPRYVLLENVPGLLGISNCDPGQWDLDHAPKDNLRYFGTILADLAEIGFDARWTVLGADDVGAPHRRKRVWIVAYHNQARLSQFIGSKTKLTGAGSHWVSLPHNWGIGNPTKTFIRRGVYGVACRVDRLKAIGNGQIPAVVRAAWEILTG